MEDKVANLDNIAKQHPEIVTSTPKYEGRSLLPLFRDPGAVKVVVGRRKTYRPEDILE